MDAEQFFIYMKANFNPEAFPITLTLPKDHYLFDDLHRQLQPGPRFIHTLEKPLIEFIMNTVREEIRKEDERRKNDQ